MKTINILITALGGDIGGNILNILLQQKGVKLNIVGTDIKETVFSADKVNKFYKVARISDPSFKQKILKIVEDNKIDIVIPVSENEIIWFNENRQLFKHLKLKVLINNPRIINTFLNKLYTSFELDKIGILTPKTFLLSEFTNQLAFPLIIKSIYSINSKEIYTINNKRQLDYLKTSITEHDDYIIQQYVGSIEDEYTTTVYRDEKRLEVITFKRKLTGGMTSFATICNEKEITNYAKKIAELFDLNGCINIQSRKVGNQFYIFEINPRFSSTVFIRDHFGFQDVIWWINNALQDKLLTQMHTEVQTFGSAVLGYQYKFFNTKVNHENR